MNAAVLVAVLIACRPASADDNPPVYQAAGAPQTAPGAKTPAGENLDLLSRVLQRCSLDDRRAFLGSIRFIGDKVADMEYRSIAECLGTIKLDDLGARFVRAGRGLSAKARDGRPLPLESIFSECSASDRKAFYDGLSFRDGHLVGMRVAAVKKCEGDMPRFLSLFGSEGLDASRWKRDCYCKKPQSCAPKRGYVCNPDDC